VVRFSNLEPLFTWKDCANSIDDLKYSPDGAKLATASHDLVIDLYNARDSYTHIARCQGHSATVSHLDWSLDGTVLQSNCNDYEVRRADF
jgi:microtubule-associated protein-like 6